MSRAQRGFTLVELLVAMTVLALVSGAILGSLRHFTTFSAAVERQITGVERDDLARRFVRRQLDQLRANDGAEPVVAEDDRLTFTAPLAAAAAAPGPHRISLLIEDDPRAGAGARRLVLEYIGVAHAGRRAPQRRILLDGLRDARWRYWQDGGRAPAHWAEHWRDRQRTPPLVRLQVDWPVGDDRIWTDLIVAPRIVAHVAGAAQG